MKALVLALALCGAAAQAAPLDGSAWRVRENTFKSKIFFWKYDHLLFKDGLVESADLRRRFPAAAYAASESNGAVRWNATLVGDGKMIWEGTRRGDRMQGTRTWVAPDGRTKTVFWTAKQSLPK